MSSIPGLQFLITTIQMNNYVTLATLTTIGYDYILTFSDEIEFIWNKPWSRVSTLYVLARYFGLCNVIISVILGSSFLPGPATGRFEGGILYIFSEWAGLIFIGAAEFVMILRVWALYNRSRFILGILLTLYAIEVSLILAECVLISTRNVPVVVIDQVVDFSFCIWTNSYSILTEIVDIVQIALGALMCLLVIIQFVRESLQMYKAYKVTKRFRLNRYMSILVREGIVYFLVMLVFSLLNILFFVANIPEGGWWTLLPLPEYIPPFILVPRFILWLRALYARDLRGICGSDIDTAFGSTSVTGHRDGATASAIVFADAGQNEGLDQGEEIQMEERTVEIRGAGSA